MQKTSKQSKPRNNIIEFGRFIYSLLVLGYHVQFSYDDDKIDIFENGALAVEYYFLLSGYFLSRSLEKIAKDEKNNIFIKTFYFMKNKITALLNVHVVCIVAILIIIAACDTKNWVDKFLNGLPSVFLVQMIIVWTADFNKALIIPEWYLSSMLICMLFMVPIFLLISKKLKGIYSTLILIGIVALIVIISGLATKWGFNQNLLYDIRAWGEMCVGMLSNYFSIYLKTKEFGNGLLLFTKILEIICYVAPAILGIVPINKNNEAILMVITMICIFFAVTFTFAEKGNMIKSEKVNFVFGYLGALSLPIYLIHPVLISLIDYVDDDMPRWEKYVIVFPVTLVLAFIYRVVADFLNKKIKERKDNKEIKEIAEKKEEKQNKEEEAIDDNQNKKEKQIVGNNVGSNEYLV